MMWLCFTLTKYLIDHVSLTMCQDNILDHVFSPRYKKESSELRPPTVTTRDLTSGSRGSKGSCGGKGLCTVGRWFPDR